MSYLNSPSSPDWETVLPLTSFVGGAVTETINVDFTEFNEYEIIANLLGVHTTGEILVQDTMALMASGVAQTVVGQGNALNDASAEIFSWSTPEISLRQGYNNTDANLANSGKYVRIMLSSFWRSGQVLISAECIGRFTPSGSGGLIMSSSGKTNATLASITALRFTRPTRNFSPRSTIAIWGKDRV